MSIVILLPNAVGDTVMTTPALRLLRASCPNQTLRAIGTSVACQTLMGQDLVDAFDPHPIGRYRRLHRGLTALGLRRDAPHAALIFPNSFLTAFSAVLTGASRRVGYATAWRQWMLTDAIARPGRQEFRRRSTVDNYLNVVERFIGSAPEGHLIDRMLRLRATKADVDLADQFFRSNGLNDLQPTTTIQCGGAYGDSKRWPPSQAARLAQMIHDQWGHNVVIHCGPAERHEAHVTETTADRRYVRSMARCDQLPIALSRGLLARSTLAISTDSGPRHLAIALGIPTVTLFGPTDPQASASDFAHETIVTRDMGCSPCWHRSCPLQHNDCMNGLTAALVFAKAKDRLNRSVPDLNQWAVPQAA